MGSFLNGTEVSLVDHAHGKGTHTPAGTFYFGLSRAALTEDGSGLDEPSAGSYARKDFTAADINPAVDRLSDNANDITMVKATASWGDCTHWFVADSLSGGTIYVSGPIVKSSHAVQVANTGGAGAGSFEVTGDVTGSLTVGKLLTIHGSTGNDAVYTIRSGSTYSGGSGRTTISVDEAVSDATADGTLYVHATKTIGTNTTFVMPAGEMKLWFKAAGISDYLANALLDHFWGITIFTAPGNIYLAASTADPTDDVSGLAEPIGYDYVRKSTAAGDWNPAGGDPTVLDNATEFAFAAANGGDWGTITHSPQFDQAIASHAVTGVNTGGAGSGSFEVATDITGSLEVGAKLRINGSTGNDAIYTIRTGSSFGGGTTTVNVDEAVSDATVDGTLYLLGNMLFYMGLDSSVPVQGGDMLKFPAGEWNVQMN